MNEVYFNHMVGSDSKTFPTCDYYEWSGTYNFGKLRKDDPNVETKLKELKEKYYVHDTKCGIHYFNEIGFLQCNVCGWTP